MFFPSNAGSLISFQDGGNAIEGLSGLKLGLRRDKIGYFVKVRPGFLHFSKTLADFGSRPLELPPLTPITHAALDIGSVFEVYTSRRTLLRFDAGDTLAFIRKRRLTGFPQDPGGVVEPGDLRHMIELSICFGFRF
jgi:hypothetical protein